MNSYENIKGKLTEYVQSSPFPRSWTTIGYALYLTRQMLEKETSKHKTMIIFNDGDSDIFVLIAVGPNVLAPGLETYDNAVRIAGGRENMIPAKDFQNFDTNVLQQVLKEFCREVY
ncbi:hypothetical protein Y032_0116g572 [Ancylostoma ceylanicum]|nr:hypothetical protein Y032_0116g572 [Ancylostoma ceylanicum]